MFRLQKRRSATFTELRISDYGERPGVINLLLQWPAVLTRFVFRSIYHNQHTMDYPMFEEWLLIHKYTLKHVDIGFLHRHGSNRLFNARRFPKLELLRLSRWQMHNPAQFMPEDSNVLGPSLKTFAWDFTVYDQHSEGWSDFGESEANWVKTLAEIAISCKSALREIHIQFTPDELWGTTEEMGYPWDWMEKVKDESFKPNGLGLVYNEPSISKDTWLNFCRTGEYGGDGNEEIADGTADSEQCSMADEEESANLFASVLQSAYQGEDIRGYLISVSKARGG
jgi:hypothetical protein